MTPLQIEAAARNRYNALNDTFWSTDEIMDLIYAACLELSTETLCIENIYTTTSTASSREFTFPSETISIYRVEYDGDKLTPISWIEDDALTGSNTSTTSEGTPRYYTIFDNTIFVRPIPSTGSLTVKIYAYEEEQPVTTSSTLATPSRYHMGIVYFVLAEMYEKAKDPSGSTRYRQLWLNEIARAKRFEKRRKRGDMPTHSKVEDGTYGLYRGIS